MSRTRFAADFDSKRVLFVQNFTLQVQEPDLLQTENCWAQLVALANKRGLHKTASQLQLMTRQNALVQKAYDIHHFSTLPLMNSDQVKCYYFRNKSGDFWGPLELYNIFNATETDVDHATYWGEWQKIFKHFFITDVDSFSHMTLLTQPIPKEVIMQFCEGLYDARRENAKSGALPIGD